MSDRKVRNSVYKVFLLVLQIQNFYWHEKDSNKQLYVYYYTCDYIYVIQTVDVDCRVFVVDKNIDEMFFYCLVYLYKNNTNNSIKKSIMNNFDVKRIFIIDRKIVA